MGVFGNCMVILVGTETNHELKEAKKSQETF